MKARIIITDDHKIIRDGLRSLLEKENNIEVIAEAENGRQAVELTKELKPDMVIMDITMPELNGIEATRQITANFEDVKIIALSMHSDRRFISEILRAGAKGYLLKDCAFEEMVRAINEVMANRMYLSPRIANIVVDEYVINRTTDTKSVYNVLSPRERQVLQLLAEGKSTKEIALDLSVSVKTIESHRHKVMEKLDIRSIAELTKYAIREGLTDLNN